MSTKNFRIEPVTGLRDILQMRHVRNEVKSYMTHNTEDISLFAQLKWYFTVYYGEFEGFLVYVDDEVVGYGLLRFKDGQVWVSGGLKKSRGRGYGERLFRFLTQAALDFFTEEVWLDVQIENTRAVNLYRKLGYDLRGYGEGTFVMSYRAGGA